VRVAGEPEAVQVDARDASVEEVLAALGTSFGLQFRGASTLERRIAGTYRGSLQHVVRRLLDGYDFIMKTNLDEIEVMVLSGGKAGEAQAAGPASVADPALPSVPTKTQTVKQRREQPRRH
jgi:hypothetical protein